MDAVPPSYSHIGWVPCISGSLFFEFAACGLGENRITADINYVEKDAKKDIYTRQILISSTVDWKDEGSERLEGMYRVLLHASFPIDSKCIQGDVYIIPASIVEHSWSIIDSIIEKTKQLVDEEEDVSETLSALLQEVEKYNHQKLYRVTFHLDSLGFVFLKFNEEASTETYSNKTKATTIRQAYYYIKYSWHRHRHHNDTAESLTTIHRIQNNANFNGAVLIDDLKKSLVELKRDFHPSDYKSLYHAKGMAAYTQSLVESCYKVGFISEKAKHEQEKYLSNISCSLDVLAEAVQREIDTRSLISNNFRSILLFVLAIIAPLTLIFRNEIRDEIIPKDERYSSIAIEVISKTAGSDINIAVLGLFVWLFYCVYQKMNLTFGSSFLVFQLFKDSIDFIVKEKQKADILAKLGILIAIVMLLLGFHSFVTS